VRSHCHLTARTASGAPRKRERLSS